VTERWFSPGTHVSSTNKTDLHDITEILLKVVLNTISLNLNLYSLTGLSLNKWYQQMGLQDNDDLEDWMISHLLNELRVSSYLDILQCKRTNSEYVPSNNGWKKGMSFTMTPQYIIYA
jgi:hypothetical protein